jgi:hypothetical protein
MCTECNRADAADAEAERLFALHLQLLQEIAALQEKINELTDAIEETKRG